MITEKKSDSTLGAMYVHEVARDLLISESKVRNLLATGDLRGVKIGDRWVIFRDDVIDYINKKRGLHE